MCNIYKIINFIAENLNPNPQPRRQNIDKEKVHFAGLDDNLWQEITAARNSGKLVLCMGAGTIDGWIREQLTKN